MAGLPLAGTPGVYDPRNPTLLPNFDRSVASLNGTVDHQSPAAFVALNPRVAATATATVGGTVTAGNVVTLTVTSVLIPSGSRAFAYTVLSGDTLASIAEALAELVTAWAKANSSGLYAEANEAVVTLAWDGPAGNSATVSATSPGTETVTLSPVSGTFTGGSGPIIAINNFNYTYNGSTISFFYGMPYVLGNDLVALMVVQGMPIV